MHNTLHILLSLAHVLSSINLLTVQHNFLPLSQFLLGALLFLITIKQIKKKDSFQSFSSLAI
ncbi:hypothetical protein [Bacillus paramobilis]|uniref:hypothetical protein n=1 Tax=Bacillus paramobilis TaxID=2817477 RepID=UPI000B44E717|nr:hypothetical protein MLA2C4_24925 [Bacillus mobilis]PEU75335.1 hypothetical protein CN386_18720 [Bacillus cereus]PGT67872.1 hypothetical protein COD14_18850 [Bacillus cereus]PGV92723.1 hypothetical protein COD86_19725 [Bacillus cereus]